MEEDAPPHVAYIVSEQLAKVSSLLPSNRNRSALVHSLINAFELLRRVRPIRPSAATLKELTQYHEQEYIDYVIKDITQNSSDDSGLTQEYGIEDDCPPFRGMSQYVQLIAGASLTAARALMSENTQVSICWDGGRHHAQRGRASGFCYVADVVLSILCLRRFKLPSSLIPPRILYLDLDLHYGDAVAHAFTSISSVLTLSIHYTSPHFFPSIPKSALTSPDTPDPYTLSLPLDRGASCETFRRVWLRAVRPVVDAYSPDIIVSQLGTDGLAGDPCKVWNWSLGGEGGFGWCVKQILSFPGKKLLLGGGGYNSPNTARAWAYATSLAAGKPLDFEAEIPHHHGFPQYAPSFTLDVPAGHMRDENSDEYLVEIENTFRIVAERISSVRLAEQPP